MSMVVVVVWMVREGLVETLESFLRRSASSFSTLHREDCEIGSDVRSFHVCFGLFRRPDVSFDFIFFFFFCESESRSSSNR